MAPYDECKPRTAEGSRPMDMKILAIVLLSIGLSTIAGVAGGIFFRDIPRRMNDIVLGLPPE